MLTSPLHSTDWREERKEVHYKNCHRRHRCSPSLFPFCQRVKQGRLQPPARESRFQFEITRVAWHEGSPRGRPPKKWRVSTQNGGRESERLFLPFLPLHRFEERISAAAADASVVRAVSLESGNGRAEMAREERRGEERCLCLCLRLCLSRKMSALKCPSLSSLGARQEGSCLPACLPCGIMAAVVVCSAVQLQETRHE